MRILLRWQPTAASLRAGCGILIAFAKINDESARLIIYIKEGASSRGAAATDSAVGASEDGALLFRKRPSTYFSRMKGAMVLHAFLVRM